MGDHLWVNWAKEFPARKLEESGDFGEEILVRPIFANIPQFVPSANYRTHVRWQRIPDLLAEEKADFGDRFQMDPDFQRAHVWTETQQRRYIEFILKGGPGSRDIIWNCAGWLTDYRGPYVLVDGKQRLNAVLKFLANELRVFGYYLKEFEDRLPSDEAYFIWHVNNLETRAKVLQWYIDLNAGGVAHTDEEIGRVRELLAKELA